MWDSIPGPWDHDLSQGQTLNRLSRPGVPGRLPDQQSSSLYLVVLCLSASKAFSDRHVSRWRECASRLETTQVTLEEQGGLDGRNSHELPL